MKVDIQDFYFDLKLSGKVYALVASKFVYTFIFSVTCQKHRKQDDSFRMKID